MKHKSIPLLYRFIQGSIGKTFVVKHYGIKVVITKYPDMTNILRTEKQRKQHELFRQAVKYAKQVIADPIREAAWQKKLKRQKGVYNEAIKKFLLRASKKSAGALSLSEQIIRNSFKNMPARERKRFFEHAHVFNESNIYSVQPLTCCKILSTYYGSG